MPSNSSVLDPAPVDTSKETAAGGGSGGDKTGGPALGPLGSSDIPGDPPGDFARLAKMLERIQTTLEGLINLKPPIIPKELQKPLQDNWPVAKGFLSLGIARLQHETKSDLGRYLQKEMFLRLATAGLTGDMLKMKEAMLNFSLDRLDPQILTPTTKESWPDRQIAKIVRWFRPASELMNSILGSLLGHIPGGEIVKELKEHLNASYEIADALRGDRE
jgi:hypothetical protein